MCSECLNHWGKKKEVSPVGQTEVLSSNHWLLCSSSVRGGKKHSLLAEGYENRCINGWRF